MMIAIILGFVAGARVGYLLGRRHQRVAARAEKNQGAEQEQRIVHPEPAVVGHIPASEPMPRPVSAPLSGIAVVLALDTDDVRRRAFRGEPPETGGVQMRRWMDQRWTA